VKYVILENIRSAHNVGSIFRTADGAGVTKIFLVGYTPRPLDRFGRVQKEIQKTSLGASESIVWEYSETIEPVLALLKTENITVVAVEQSPQAVLLHEFTVPENVAYVFGNEVEGVDGKVLAVADTIVELPMRGQKESLNVSVVAGIILYHGVV
jgi:tRNA G18 (ribose-2'-O)-methylase SpoU